MSTGAELSIVALPVGAIGVVVAGAALAAAGVVIVGGVALVGVGRLTLSAGTYVRDRLQERASICAAEHERFLRLRAAAKAPQQVKPRIDQQAFVRHLKDEAEATKVAAPLERSLLLLQAQYDVALRRAEQRAQLAASLEIYNGHLEPELVRRVRTLLNMATDALADDQLEQALAELRGAVARTQLDELAQAQAALLEHQLELASLLAHTAEPALRAELSAWHHEVNGMIASRDIAAVRARLHTGATLLASARERNEAASSQMRADELSTAWGQLQAVGGLLDDLHRLAGVAQAEERLTGDVAGLIDTFKTLAARYDVLSADTAAERSALRVAATELRRDLEQLQGAGLAMLDGYYQRRVAAAIERSMRAESVTFTTVEAPSTADDGSILLRATSGPGALVLRVHADGRVSYDADGFGDERCLLAIYRLRARLRASGVAFQMADPQLKPQIEVAMQALEAIEALGAYTTGQLSIQRSGGSLVIEAGDGASFQRQLARVNRHGELSYVPALPQLDARGAQAKVEAKVARAHAEGRNIELELKRREEQRSG